MLYLLGALLVIGFIPFCLFSILIFCYTGSKIDNFIKRRIAKYKKSRGELNE